MRTPASLQVAAALTQPFKVDSISKTSAPNGTDSLWHSYVISQGPNTISGMRTGTKAEVTVLVQEMVDRLNERRMGKTRPRTKG